MASALIKDKKSATCETIRYEFTWEMIAPGGSKKEKGKMNVISANVVRANLIHVGGEENLQGKNPDSLYNNCGFTLVGLLFAVAIMGILAAIAIPGWIQFEQDAALSSSVNSLATAKTALFRCGAQGTGATMSAQYQQGEPTTLTIQNGNNSFCWAGHLQEGANPLIGSTQLHCTSVTATGLTSATVSCPAPQSGLWSVQYAGLTASVP